MTVLKLRPRGSGCVSGNDLDFIEDIVDAQNAPGISFGCVAFSVCGHRARQSHPSVADPNADLACIDKRVLSSVTRMASSIMSALSSSGGLISIPFTTSRTPGTHQAMTPANRLDVNPGIVPFRVTIPSCTSMSIVPRAPCGTPRVRRNGCYRIAYSKSFRDVTLTASLSL